MYVPFIFANAQDVVRLCMKVLLPISMLGKKIRSVSFYCLDLASATGTGIKYQSTSTHEDYKCTRGFCEEKKASEGRNTQLKERKKGGKTKG